ncbi:MAG TPA: aldo/keto reductase [Syntrophorhabdus sp.]|nr:aldo/keto reductase [Syntrophorhabdus sp.]
MNTLETIYLGRTAYKISRLGLGCWAIGGHGWGKVREQDSFRTVKCALDSGISFFDTADVYGLGKSETILADVLGLSRTRVLIASKGGVRWNDNGHVWTDTSPIYLRLAVENSLKRLKMDCIPLYYIHKLDGVTPIQESIAALERMREEGKIGSIGVSNVSADQLLQALQVAPVAAVQVRLNIFDREPTKDLFDICKKKGITLVAWGALADGLLTGKFKAYPKFADDDHRSRMPEFSKELFPKYERLLRLLEKMATEKGRRVGQLALRWVLDLEPFTCALFGAKTDVQVMENLGADGWNLTDEDLSTIDSIMFNFQPKRVK